MKYFIYFILFLIILFNITSCKKNNKTNQENDQSDDNLVLISNNITQYVSLWSVCIVGNENDINKIGTKKESEIKEKKYLTFGSKVNVIQFKKAGEIESYKIQLPDDSIFWSLKKYFSEKFIVINQVDVECYDQPELTYKTKIKLQPGDFGIYKNEKDGFINVDFFAFRPLKDGGDKKRIGNKWIKGGYTDNIDAAREAFYLYIAYFKIIESKNNNEALKMLEKGLESNTSGEETVVTSVIKSLQNELKVNESNIDE